MKIGDQVGWQWGTRLAVGDMIASHGRSNDPASTLSSFNGSNILRLSDEARVIKGGDDV